MVKALTKTEIPGYECRRGKVRDIYYMMPGDTIVIVATDRISAFDVVMANGIPDKGKVLTALTVFWLEALGNAVLPNHFITTNFNCLPDSSFQRPGLEGRIMLCRRAQKVFPIECVVRGYLTGSGWRDYQKTGQVCGIQLPEGLKECQRLPDELFPIFTPATKAPTGHDKNITFERACQIVGINIARQLRDWSLGIYRRAHNLALEHGIIIADTKFEFGVTGTNTDQIMLIDEVLTPDSSRFWPAKGYEPGHSQPSFDKQFVRDYLQGLCNTGEWGKKPPGPRLPDDVVVKTRQKYLGAYRHLTGKELQI